MHFEYCTHKNVCLYSLIKTIWFYNLYSILVSLKTKKKTDTLFFYKYILDLLLYKYDPYILVFLS